MFDKVLIFEVKEFESLIEFSLFFSLDLLFNTFFRVVGIRIVPMPVRCEKQQSHRKHDDDKQDDLRKEVRDALQEVANETEHDGSPTAIR